MFVFCMDFEFLRCIWAGVRLMISPVLRKWLSLIWTFEPEAKRRDILNGLRSAPAP